MAESKNKNTPPGAGVDASGNPDPTANVQKLVDAAMRRQDDLRAASDRCIAEMATLREVHSRELREAEAKRIDAIRAVDVAAVQQAAQVSATQATTLASVVATSAEALRTQVAAAAGASQVALAAALDPIQKDIADLRRAQYEAQGQKTNVVENQAASAGLNMWLGVAIAVGALLLSAAGVAITLIVR